ncbi:MAG: hypothetical protein M1824_001043 [Vezdaea acicularis]|nr:MAG: hypothetical protein M1824_001043 [Vezdaea acicularis]
MSTEQENNLDAHGPPENLTAIDGGLASSLEGDDMDVDRIVGGESTASATNVSVDIQRRGAMPSSVRNATLGRPNYTRMEESMPLIYCRPAIPAQDPPMNSLEAILECSGDQWPYDNQFSSNPMIDLSFDPYGDADGNPTDISELIDFSRFTED